MKLSKNLLLFVVGFFVLQLMQSCASTAARRCSTWEPVNTTYAYGLGWIYKDDKYKCVGFKPELE